jgi:CsoR family transcriptional regulator, copper-sensing transcriptional repressor
MIPSDLISDFKTTVKTAIGQLEHVNRSIGSAHPEEILMQLKAADALVSKATLLLLDEVYRKALAEKISFAHQNCPGNCGNEDQIERLRQIFPQIPIEQLPEKLVEADQLMKKIKKIITEKTWTTPPPLPDISARNIKK